jgi:hypothetical protein
VGSPMARPGDGTVRLTDRPRPPLSVYMPPYAPVTRSPLGHRHDAPWLGPVRGTAYLRSRACGPQRQRPRGFLRHGLSPRSGWACSGLAAESIARAKACDAVARHSRRSRSREGALGPLQPARPGAFPAATPGTIVSAGHLTDAMSGRRSRGVVEFSGPSSPFWFDARPPALRAHQPIRRFPRLRRAVARAPCLAPGDPC